MSYYRPRSYQFPPPLPPPDLPALPSLSTIALEDIVEGQQRTTNGLVSLLSQERTTTETNTREHKQQLADLTSLSQNFLTFMPDVEQKFSVLESSIRANCTNPENVELQNRVKDMIEVVANLGRIAEGFACSTGLRLVPTVAPNPWAWANNSQPLQSDPTSFSGTFTHAPRLFPAAIPNSSRSSVFAHSTGPARSVHWPSDLDDVHIPSWSGPWSSDPYFPVHFGANTAPRASRSSLSGGGLRSHPVPFNNPYIYPPAPLHYPPTSSEPSLPPSSPFGCRMRAPRMPFGGFSPPPTLQPSPPLSPVPPAPSISPSQTESDVRSMRRSALSPITERTSPSSTVPPPPAFGRTPANGPSPSTSSIDTFSTPSAVNLNPPTVTQRRFSLGGPRPEMVSVGPPAAPDWFRMVSRPSPSVSSADDDYTIPSPTSVAIPNLHPVDTFRWSSLFPSAPIVADRSAPEGNLLLRSSTPTPEDTISSPMSSPARSVISYATTSEPLTPLSRVSGEFIPATITIPAPHPNKPTTDKVDTPPKAAAAAAVLPTPIAETASTSSAVAPPPRSSSSNPLAIQLVSFFFDTIQRLFQVPATVDLNYNGFEVSFATDSIIWNDADAPRVKGAAEEERVFELMPLPANAALHRYIKDLSRVRVDLAALPAAESEGPAVEQLALRVKEEQDVVQKWMRSVCDAAGATSIADVKFSPRK